MKPLLAESLIRDVHNFPKEGIVFKDIAPVLQNPPAMREICELLGADARAKGAEVIMGIESRGFVFGAPIAVELGLPFVMIRKLGKLPYKTITEEYELEYGSNHIEMHIDSVNPGQRVYVVDDLLATGGTAKAAASLITKLNGNVCGYGFMIELAFLNGREKLGDHPIEALIKF